MLFRSKIKVMKIKFIICLGFVNLALGSNVQIRLANKSDLEPLLQLDYDVSFEYFKPMYQEYYSQFEFGKNPDKFLLDEVRVDREIFSSAINLQDESKLFCAYDQDKNKYAGLLLIEQIFEGDLELELLLIHSDYRRYGIGKRIVYEGINSFFGVKRCYVQPFRFGNEKTLSFYEKIGFKRLGLAPSNKINSYGVPFSDLYFNYCYEL